MYLVKERTKQKGIGRRNAFSTGEETKIDKCNNGNREELGITDTSRDF
jgi:hypothetical protein